MKYGTVLKKVMLCFRSVLECVSSTTMDFNLIDIPIQIEGVDLPAIAGPSHQDDEYLIEESTLADSASSEDSDEEKPTRIHRKDISKLSAHLKGLMGEANLRYARGDLETSKKMCFEVIRQAPEAYEPYMTLAQMYETSNLKKYKGYLMLASHLASNNVSILCRLAEVFAQEGDIKEAVQCYSRAVTRDSKNISLHRKRLELLEKKPGKAGGEKVKLIAKQTMANNISKKEHKMILQLVMEVAKEHYEQKNYIRAVEVLRIPLRRIPGKLTRDVINMMLEVLILLERYSECLDVFTQFCGFSFDVSITEDKNLFINSYVKPDNTHVDLKFKFYVCLVKLRAEHLFVAAIDGILVEDDINAYGDLYLDFVEALMLMSYQYHALKLLVPMVKSRSFSTAAVWLKYAECLSACQMPDQAVEAYFTVMSLAPSHVEVLYPLAMLLLQQNKRQEALDVLSQDLSTNKLDVAVLLEQMKLLKQINDLDSYWKSVELLLSRHCVILKYPEDLKCVITLQTFKEKVTKIRKMRGFRNENEDIESDVISIREPSVEEEYGLFKEILQLAVDRKEYAMFQKFTFMAMCSKRFQKYFNEIYLCGLYSCILNHDTFHSYNMIREILVKHPKNNLAWNWFSVITASPQDIRHLRFVDRLKHKFRSEDHALLTANNNMAMGNYSANVSYLVKHFKQTQSPYSAFMLAVSMLQYNCQRKAENSKKKILAETVTYLFLNYSQLRTRKVEQEVYYNLGRMYQQLGIMYLAEFYYKKVFEVQNDFLERYPNLLSLKYEAAYNLHLLYKNSGNFVAARQILMEHIVM